MKNIEWLKEEITEILLTSKRDGTNYFYYRDLKEKIYNAIDQLDGPEVLSQKWISEKSIDTHVDTVNGDIQVTFILDDLENLIVPKKELPVIPKFVADWIEEMKQDERPLYSAVSSLLNKTNHTWSAWKSANKNFSEIVARAWLDGYTVAEEQKYYALVKGHEVIGDYANLKYWNSDTFDKRVFLGERDVVRDWVSAKMSKLEWNKLSINDSNADFVKVKEKQK